MTTAFAQILLNGPGGTTVQNGTLFLQGPNDTASTVGTGTLTIEDNGVGMTAEELAAMAPLLMRDREMLTLDEAEIATRARELSGEVWRRYGAQF